MKVLWIVIYFIVLIWSAINPKDYLIWLLETGPMIAGGIILLATYKKFRLTPLSYFWLLLFFMIFAVGGHYTYAEVPLFNYIKEVCGHSRNNFDKLAHLMQGFIPAIVAREVYIRKKVFTNRGWMNFCVVCFCLALSAFYELIEWWAALISEEAAESFLGTQGYVWDTQSDMGLALLGSILALAIYSKLHDKQIEELNLNEASQ